MYSISDYVEINFSFVGLPTTKIFMSSDANEWTPDKYFRVWIDTIVTASQKNWSEKGNTSTCEIDILKAKLYFTGGLYTMDSYMTKLRNEDFFNLYVEEAKAYRTHKLLNSLTSHITVYSEVTDMLYETYHDWMEHHYKLEQLSNVYTNDQVAHQSKVLDIDGIIASFGTNSSVEDDPRIPVDIDKRKRLIELFLRLAEVGIMSQEDVIYWLRADFQGFRMVKDQRILEPKTGVGNIICFVAGVFYNMEDGTKRMKLYREMLRKRIKTCNNKTPRYIQSHFGDIPKKYPDELPKKTDVISI